MGFVVLVSAGFVWNEDVRVAVGWRCGMVGGNDCGWWCGVRLLRMGVWLERCRDGNYAINALRCDVWGCLIKCPLGVGYFVKCVVWWLIWVVFVVWL